jgi:beta-glucosidase
MNSAAELSGMSLAEKAALTSGSDLWHTAAVAGLPEIMLTDGPHGVRKAESGRQLDIGRSEPSTCFPPAVALGSSWDPELVRRVGAALGEEAQAMGVAVLLGPGINLKRSPLGGRNFEYYSEDPLLTGLLAAEWVNGLQSEDVGASLKHFAVNSQETDRMRISADVDERPLRELYLRAFERVVRQARPWTVMCSYNKVNGVYAAENHWLLTEVLRGEWGFEGVVVSDWLAVGDRVASLRAGLDLAMPGPDDGGDRALEEAVRSGAVGAGALDTAAGRVLELVRRSVAGARPDAACDAAAHDALAREAAGRGIVLLKNEGGLLPLPREGTTIAVIGEYARTPRFQGGGSSQINPVKVTAALPEITALTSAEVTFAAGYAADGSTSGQLAAEAVQAASSSDVAVVFVGTGQDTEGADRDTLDLPAAQVELVELVLAVNPRTVVVLTNGGVVLTSLWDQEVPALIEGWLLGQAGGGAIADVLFGVVNPSGRLAETIPLRLADHPSYLDFPGEAGQVSYGEGLFAGYRGFDAREQEVAYPFGFGLSYTAFSYGEVAASVTGDGIEVRVPVTNTGDRDGREVVQVYASLPASGVKRPLRELKGFASVPVPAGQTVPAVIRIDRADLAYWEPRLRRWVVEGGDYVLAAGASSRDLRAEVTVTVKGDEVRVPLTAQSTLAEWMHDPQGVRLLGEAFAAAAAAGSGEFSAAANDPQLLGFLGSMPLARLAAFPGSPLTPDMVENLAAADAAQ